MHFCVNDDSKTTLCVKGLSNMFHVQIIAQLDFNTTPALKKTRDQGKLEHQYQRIKVLPPIEGVLFRGRGCPSVSE